MPSITQLEYILAVDKFKHFGKAAKNCHVSQPSLSMQIQKAEDELGLTIFDRSKKPIKATEKGLRIIEQAISVTREYQKLLQASKEEKETLSGEFSLGVIPTLAPYIVPLFIEQFSRDCPNVRLYIDEMKTEDIISKIKRDDLDGAILATPLREQGIKERVLFYEPFYLYSKKYGSKSSSIAIEELENDGIWLLQDGHCFKNQIINFCSIEEQCGAFRNISFESGNLETLRYLIKQTDGYTLLPYLFVRNLPRLERDTMVRKFKTPVPTREVSLIHRRDHWKLGILEKIEKEVKASIPDGILELSKKNIEIVELS